MYLRQYCGYRGDFEGFWLDMCRTKYRNHHENRMSEKRSLDLKGRALSKRRAPSWYGLLRVTEIVLVGGGRGQCLLGEFLYVFFIAAILGAN